MNAASRRRSRFRSGEGRFVVLLVTFLTLVAVMAAFGALAVFLRENKTYRATAWLRVESEAPYMLEPPSSYDWSAFAKTQAAMIRSPLVLEQVLARPDIARMTGLESAKSPVALLQSRLTVIQVDDSELLSISCDWPDPRDAALVTNAVVESYLKLHSQDHVLKISQQIELLEDERSRRAVNLRSLRAQVEVIRDQSRPPAELSLQWKEEEFRREERIVKRIDERVSVLRMEMRRPSRVTLLRKADPPTSPVN